MTDTFYELPLWIQIYVQIEKNPYIRGLLRQTATTLNNKCLLIIEDCNYANSQLRISWYHTNKDYVLIADDSAEGNRIYNYYYNIYETCQLFLKVNF